MREKKKWTKVDSETPAIVKLREKRKWQIALRRYVIDQNLSRSYAPYFGLEINKMRLWFESQFPATMGWSDFGKGWQFDHVIPVSFFDFDKDLDLRLCWHFLNLRVGHSDESTNRFSVNAAMQYFRAIHQASNYDVCLHFLEKLQGLENKLTIHSEKQQAFVLDNHPYLQAIKGFSAFEFELLNSGRMPEEAKREAAIIQKFHKA